VEALFFPSLSESKSCFGVLKPKMSQELWNMDVAKLEECFLVKQDNLISQTAFIPPV
jgi:hypothetical protein